LKFDYLVLALGSETNYFDIPGLKENSFALKTFEDAIKIRDAIWLKVSEMKDLPTDAKNLQIVIGGGGSTGVELAGEIKEWLCEKEIGSKCNIQTTIIERAPTVLSSFSEKVIKMVNERLGKLDIKIMSNESINKVIPKAVVLESGKIIPFDIFVWTGGVKIPAVAMKLGLKTNERIETTPFLECLPVKHGSELNSKVFAIGDNAGSGPQVARAAIIEADIAAKNIIEEIKKENNLCREARRYRYKPKNYPYIIPVGGKFAVAKIGPFVISGFWGWFLKGLVELNYLISIMPFWKALKIWFTGLRIFIQNDRLG
ncbi:MAG: FAD-dependent oxidoreductase, partial [Patescibacteria group bacterium]